MQTLRRFGPVLLMAMFALPLAAQQQPQPKFTIPDTNTSITYSIRGTLRDAATNQGIPDVLVDLRSVQGNVVTTVVSGFSGDFEFDGLQGGDYFVEVRAIGYQPLRQEVIVDGFSVEGLQVMLRSQGPAHRESSQTTISKRELSIPHKAHDAMIKGSRLLYEKSDAKGSLKEFQRATQAYPGYYEAYAQMGIADMKLGDNDVAEKALRKSMDLSDGKYATAFWLLAMLYSNNHRFSDAEPLARKAAELDQNAWQAKFELGRALFGLNRDAEAETSAQAAAKLAPDNGPLHLLLANIHMRMRNYPALLGDLNAYLKIEPKGPTADKARQMRDKVQQGLAAAAASTAGTKDPSPNP
jgi:Flp pilus assembly protein TadD